MKVTEKLSKYKDLEIETSQMWGMRTETIPVIIGALGAIKKGLETYLGRIPGQISISELQKNSKTYLPVGKVGYCDARSRNLSG